MTRSANGASAATEHTEQSEQNLVEPDQAETGQFEAVSAESAGSGAAASEPSQATAAEPAGANPEGKAAQAGAATADTTQADAAQSDGAEPRKAGFNHWRRTRPFIAGLLMILGGIVILMPAYLSFEVSNIVIQVSTISGVSTFIIGALLIACGLMTWFGGGSRILTGVTAIILGIVALPTSNFGGFVLGTLLALLGGALALAWSDFSKQEVIRQKQEKKAAKKARKSGNTAAAVLAAVTVTGVAAGVTATAGAPEAQAQLEMPQLPKLQLPEIPAPPQPKGEADGQAPKAGQEQPNAPKPPKAPELPKLPKIDPPEIKLPKELKEPKLPKVPEEYEMDLTPPGPIEGLRGIPGNTFQITTSSTALLGNMKMSLITLETEQGPKPALRIDADKAVLDNLAMEMPGTGAGTIWQRTGPGKTSTLTGNFHIIVSKLTVTPEINGVRTIPLTIDASWAPEKIRKEAAKIGLGAPDAISEKMKMLDGTMETYMVSADRADLPHGTTLAP